MADDCVVSCVPLPKLIQPEHRLSESFVPGDALERILRNASSTSIAVVWTRGIVFDW